MSRARKHIDALTAERDEYKMEAGICTATNKLLKDGFNSVCDQRDELVALLWDQSQIVHALANHDGKFADCSRFVICKDTRDALAKHPQEKI